MNDFSELEIELRKLRPASPSPILPERVEEAMLENCRVFAAADARFMAKWRWRFIGAPHKLALGFGLAAAAVLLLLAQISREERGSAAKESAPVSSVMATRPTSANEFIPAGATQVVYNPRDEGLRFADGSQQPLRRLRYQTHQTWQWRNPTTGASLRVSYPSEEVVLVPVSGQ